MAAGLTELCAERTSEAVERSSAPPPSLSAAAEDIALAATAFPERAFPVVEVTAPAAMFPAAAFNSPAADVIPRRWKLFH